MSADYNQKEYDKALKAAQRLFKKNKYQVKPFPSCQWCRFSSQSSHDDPLTCRLAEHEKYSVADVDPNGLCNKYEPC